MLWKEDAAKSAEVPFPRAFQFLNSSCSNKLQNYLMKFCDLFWPLLREGVREKVDQQAGEKPYWTKTSDCLLSFLCWGVSDMLMSQKRTGGNKYVRQVMPKIYATLRHLFTNNTGMKNTLHNDPVWSGPCRIYAIRRSLCSRSHHNAHHITVSSLFMVQQIS